MRISRTWLVLLGLALVASAQAEEQQKKVVEKQAVALEAEAMRGEEDKESQQTAETRPLHAQQVAEDRVDDRDKRQLPGQHLQQQQHLLTRLPNLGGTPPQGFRSAVPVREQPDGLGNALSSTASPVHLVRQSAQPAPVQVTYRATPAPQVIQGLPQGLQGYQGLQGVPQQVYRGSLASALPSPAPSAAPVRRPQPQPSYTRAQPSRQQYADLQQVSEEANSEELEPEKEEPDRLTELLPHSKFACQGRGTGYYADEGLGCEVFHYCQDGARHSWVCPEGFTFHQVHLICMPPSNDNNCQKSSSFFFVNEYLYRPVNEEEVQRKPNVSLRYSDRYYPQNYYADGEEQQQQQQLQSQVVPHRVPLQQGLPQQQQQQQQAPRRASPAPVQYQPTPRPASAPLQAAYRQGSPSNQVFHSPEEVNIPLQLRRPVATTARNFQPTAASDEYEDDEPVYRQG